MTIELVMIVLVFALSAVLLARWTIARAILVETLKHPLQKSTIVIRAGEVKNAEEPRVKSRPAF
jgi:hypothetical protein